MSSGTKVEIDDGLILIGIGANLRSPTTGSAIDTCLSALAECYLRGMRTTRLSSWYRAAPVPTGPMPWYVNAVAAIETELGPEDLLRVLHSVEAGFGRQRSTPNAPRVLDLDLLAWGRVMQDGPALVLPHPRLQDRAFVLRPLAEIAPVWRHPTLGLTAEAMLARLWPGQIAEKFLAQPCVHT
jgi:2-amino-4-hydroxy-6-hydroxymethyldihydropteridine diphosphokinase